MRPPPFPNSSRDREIWEKKRESPSGFCTPVACDTPDGRQVVVTAYDVKTGEKIYVLERAIGESKFYASPVAANGNIYFSSRDDGAVIVMKAGESAPKLVASFGDFHSTVASRIVLSSNGRIRAGVFG